MKKMIFLSFLVAMALVDPLFAAGSPGDMKELFTRSHDVLVASVPTVIVFSFLVGIVLILFGMTELTKGDRGRGATWMLISGMFLVSIGGFLVAFNNTFSMDPTMGVTGGQGANSGLKEVPVLDSLREQMGSIYTLFKLGAQFVGLIMVIAGFTRFVRESKQGAVSKYAYLMVLMGALLINIIPIIDMITASILPTETGHLASQGHFDYQTMEDSGLDDRGKSYMTFAFTIFAIVGAFGVARGLSGLANEQDKSTGANMVRIFGGTLAINLQAVIKVIASSAGISTDNVFRSILKAFGVDV